MTITGDINYDRWRFQRAGDGYEIRRENVSLSNALLLPIKPFNLVDAAQSVTPLNELWVRKVSGSQTQILTPFNATQAYFYDIINTIDDCMVLRNCIRRLYSRPTANTIALGTNEVQMKASANVEIAIQCRKNGTDHNYRFFPQHESIATCFLDGSATFRRNGAVVTANDASFVACESASVEARYNAVHPEEASPIASLFMRHSIVARKIAVEVSVDFLQDTQISNGYSIMNITNPTPRKATTFIKRVSTVEALSGGNQAATGQGKVTACAFGADSESTVLLADWSSNLRAVLTSGVYAGSLIQWFAGSTSKFYNQPFSNCVIPAGQSFSWKGEFRMAEWASLFT